MILNELSIRGYEKNKEDMNRALSQWIKVCHKIFHERGDHDFYYTEALLTEELIPGYGIHDWLQDSKVSQQEKAFLRTIINRKQLICKTDFPGSQLFIKMDGCKEMEAVGCLAAFESENYVVSMDTSDLWKQKQILGIYVLLEEGNEESNIEEKTVCIENCCSEEHLNLMQEKEKSRIRLMVSSGKELWEKRKKLYPHLCFCDNVQEQLKEAKLSLHIEMIMKRLQILEDYFKEFDGAFDVKKVGYGCRGESEGVEKNDKLRRLRMFKTPFGTEEFFEWHISISGNFAGRIHFIPDAQHRVGIIGYIGKHLQTSKYSTI